MYIGMHCREPRTNVSLKHSSQKQSVSKAKLARNQNTRVLVKNLGMDAKIENISHGEKLKIFVCHEHQ